MLRLLGTLIAILSLALPGAAQELAVGLCVELVTRDNGISGYASVGTSAVSERLPRGATATVTEIAAPKPHWIRGRTDDTHAGTWIITKYIERILSGSRCFPNGHLRSVVVSTSFRRSLTPRPRN